MFDLPVGATPLDPDAVTGLIPDVQSRAELNEFEQANIAQAVSWARKSKFLRKGLLSLTALQKLHKQMFCITWQWAGSFRCSDTNIGVPWDQVPVQLQMLCDNTRYQIDNAVYPWTELAIRFHHRLVSIHPFANGNGRHARLAADLLLLFNRQPELTWGRNTGQEGNNMRERYILALQAADCGDYRPLLGFATS
jgi:Fic-DOC domain mobile mystery protein B